MTDPTGHTPNADAGGKAHTKPGEPHPDLEKDGRSDRDVGGPTIPPEEREKDGTTTTGGAHGDIQTKGFEPHE
jgi:hypothetical protein